MESSVRDYAEEIEIQPEELAQLEERIHTIQMLKRKYGGSIKDILAFKEQAETKLARIESEDVLDRKSTRLNSSH